MYALTQAQIAATEALLTSARAAYHSLLTGTAVARVRDSNGEEVQYSVASRGGLLDYIKTLEARINPHGRASGPMRLLF